ncbi:hypothetical protein [Chitinimonas sp. BJB300]|uniref:hypothetical protein n=1 Tax=Chitinimonas sp. BJB300 TaxID=1559339 RepID=UPI000C0D3D16|nr:hypothetical protein [Chitinimonas sp. BJB300]PHV11106.1 hypothetical protein CSQ89_12575 [Chitinimonas sp. BJB300]
MVLDSVAWAWLGECQPSTMLGRKTPPELIRAGAALIQFTDKPQWGFPLAGGIEWEGAYQWLTRLPAAGLYHPALPRVCHFLPQP